MSYGVSISLTDDGDFYIDKPSKGMDFISGTDNLIQSVKITLNTFEGENKFVPNFGLRLQDLIGRRVSDNFVKYLIRSAILKDPRIDSIEKIYIRKASDDSLIVRIILKTVEEEIVELTGGLSWRDLE